MSTAATNAGSDTPPQPKRTNKPAKDREGLRVTNLTTSLRSKLDRYKGFRLGATGISLAMPHPKVNDKGDVIGIEHRWVALHQIDEADLKGNRMHQWLAAAKIARGQGHSEITPHLRQALESMPRKGTRETAADTVRRERITYAEARDQGHPDLNPADPVDLLRQEFTIAKDRILRKANDSDATTEEYLTRAQEIQDAWPVLGELLGRQRQTDTARLELISDSIRKFHSDIQENTKAIRKLDDVREIKRIRNEMRERHQDLPAETRPGATKGWEVLQQTATARVEAIRQPIRQGFREAHEVLMETLGQSNDPNSWDMDSAQTAMALIRDRINDTKDDEAIDRADLRNDANREIGENLDHVAQRLADIAARDGMQEGKTAREIEGEIGRTVRQLTTYCGREPNVQPQVQYERLLAKVGGQKVQALLDGLPAPENGNGQGNEKGLERMRNVLLDVERRTTELSGYLESEGTKLIGKASHDATPQHLGMARIDERIEGLRRSVGAEILGAMAKDALNLKPKAENQRQIYEAIADHHLARTPAIIADDPKVESWLLAERAGFVDNGTLSAATKRQWFPNGELDRAPVSERRDTTQKV